MKWDEYFMGMAHSAAAKSKHPAVKVGAVIVCPQNRIVSIGYNGSAAGAQDRFDLPGSKVSTTIHAEENAVLFAARNIHGYTMYVTHHPCAGCMARIAQAGIKQIVIPAENYIGSEWDESSRVAAELAEQCGITVTTLEY